jgi:uncharacterized protein YggU (UPF0235/DUF167 family)
MLIALNSHPEKGRANYELIGLVAAALRLPRTALTLTRGAGSNHKILRISTTDPADITSRLIALAASTGQ